jgi:UDP-N-acetylmuramate--alanine ligase
VHMGIAGSRDERARPHPVRPRVPVSGCEARESITVTGLRALGADVVIGHSPRRPDDTDTFVFTPARGVRRRVGERQAGPAPGRRAGRPPVRRGSRHARQTSTTSLLMVALQACGLDPSFANGVLVERPD